jgi:iron complex outermembrane receptor protein
MKKLFVLLALLTPSWLMAQTTTIKGKVVTENFIPIRNVIVSVHFWTGFGDSSIFGFSNDQGLFSFVIPETSVIRKPTTLQFEHVGFKKREGVLYEKANQTYILQQDNINLESVTINSSVLSNPNTPIATQTLQKAEIEKLNLGQDLPVLLNTSPSLVFTTDAGAGVGYTSLRIRGSDQTRINVTINGVPLNDPESQGVFWVNMPDFASSANRIDIQRGVGTSTNGAGAFGANINIETFNKYHQKKAVMVNNSVGSFNTNRHTLAYNSGMIGSNFSLESRLSTISSNGYIDRAASDLNSYYISGKYLSDNNRFSVNLIHFSGTEKTYQAWYGTPESRINGTNADVEDYANRNFLNNKDKNHLLNSGRTYNYYTYENETDNYKQSHYQLHTNYQISKYASLSVSGFYVKGAGYYEQFRERDRLSRYGLDPIQIDATVISRMNIIRQRWLDNDFYGAIYGLVFKKDNTQIQLGGGINQYIGDHFGEIIWAEYSLNIPKNYRYYENKSVKNDLNNFVKITQTFKKNLSAFLDLQHRLVYYKGDGIDQNRVDLAFEKTFNFFNPKAGISYVKNKNRFYLSAAVANREPVRRDFVDAVPGETPKHETLIDFEGGWIRKTKKIALEANLFYMDYYNQLVLTGEINDVGGFVRTNAGRSYRSGIELQASKPIHKKLLLSGNLTLSDNRIREYVETVEDWNEVLDDQVFVYQKTPIAFSPSVISALVLDYNPSNALSGSIIGKYVGRQFLDNTGNTASMLDAYYTVDLRMSYKLPIKKTQAHIVLLVNNVTNSLFSSNGYTYKYLLGTPELQTERMLYPQAGRNFLLALNFLF